MWNVEFGVFLQSPEFGVWSEMRTHSCGMMDFWENCAGTPTQQFFDQHSLPHGTLGLYRRFVSTNICP